jgi:hypothetical protein
MKRLLFALLLAPSLAFAAPWSYTVERGYIGPIEIGLYPGGTTPAPAVPSVNAQAVLHVYPATSPSFSRTAVAIQFPPNCHKTAGGVDPQACAIFSLQAGDTYYPGSSYGEITLTDAGVVEPWHGTYVVAGVIPVPSSPPTNLGDSLITVCSAGCDQTSLAVALGVISDASATKPYDILVLPGVYTEPVINMKSYVDVTCQGGWFACTLTASDQTQSFIRLAASSTLTGFAIRGPTCVGCAALDSTVTGTTPPIVEHCAIRSGYYGGYCHPSSYGTCHFHEVVNQYGGSQMQEFMHVESPANLTAAWDSWMSGPSNAVVKGFVANGASATMTLDMAAFRSTGNADAVYADNGAQVRLNSCALHSGRNAIHVGPNGSGTAVRAAGTTIDVGYTKDVWVESATGVVYFSGGAATLSNITVTPGGQVVGSFSDLIQKRMVVMGNLQLVGVDGSPYAAAAPGQLVYLDANGVLTSDVNLKYISGSLAIGNPAIPGPLAISGSANSYVQAGIQNTSSGSSASSDWIATADTGTDSSNYIDVGINSSGYSDAAYNVGGALDGYLYVNGGSLGIGTQSANKVIKFHTGGTTSDKIRATISDVGLNLPGLPVYANNAAAASLAVGDIYRTSTGQLMVRY